MDRFKILSIVTSTIDQLSPVGSTQRQGFEDLTKSGYLSLPGYLPNYLGILLSLKYDYENDFLQTIQELIHADIFADYLEMARHLLDEKYKDPAAVLIGSTLENHLRKLCLKLNIPIVDTNGKHIKADKLNADLYKLPAYNSLDNKAITSWLDLRNKAAHGNYGEYSKEQVCNMLDGVSNFLQRVLA